MSGLGQGVLHPSSISCSQHGNLKALMASLLQMAHRSFVGISSSVRELAVE